MPVDPLVWVMLVAVGGWATLGHWLLIRAHHFAPAPVLSPFIYTQILWMGLSGYVVFGDVPDVSGGALRADLGTPGHGMRLKTADAEQYRIS